MPKYYWVMSFSLSYVYDYQGYKVRQVVTFMSLLFYRLPIYNKNHSFAQKAKNTLRRKICSKTQNRIYWLPFSSEWASLIYLEVWMQSTIPLTCWG
jgi:hypothetical protein